MRLPLPFVVTVIIILGFMTGSSLYYYNKNRTLTASKSNGATFSGELPSKTTTQPSKVDELTTPGLPKGLLSYPANTYKVLPKETLFAIGNKLGVSYQLIKSANNITNENSIQANDSLIIPVLDSNTEYYRVNFLINEGRATDLNQELRDKSTDDSFDPKFVAKRDAASYFKVSEKDEFTLVEEDRSKGTALVKAEGVESLNYIGLVQPRVKGKSGFWALLYVEQHTKD